MVVVCTGVLAASQEHRNQHAGEHPACSGTISEPLVPMPSDSRPMTTAAGISIEAAISMLGRHACPR